MALSPTGSGSRPKSFEQIAEVLRDRVEDARRRRLEPQTRIEQQRVRAERPTRRQRTEADIERARARRAERDRGRNIDVRA